MLAFRGLESVLVAVGLSVLVLPAHGQEADAPARPDAWYLQAGQEELVGLMLTLETGPWALAGAEIVPTRIAARYHREDEDRLAMILLVHPSTAPPEAVSTGRFALLPGDPPPPEDLVAHVAAAVRGRERAFVWSFVGERHLDAAEAAYTLADAPFLMARAHRRADTGDHAEALELLAHVITVGAEAAWARREAAYLLRRLGEEERARAELEAALALLEVQGRFPELEKARILIGLDQREDADEILSRLVATSSETACSVTGAGEDLIAVDDLEAAETLLRRVVAESPDCARAYVALSHAARTRGRAAEVLPLLEAGAERLPEDPVVVSQLADAYKLVGRRGDAISTLEDLVERGHHGPSVISPLLGLYTRGDPPPGTLARYRDRADADAEDVIAAFFTGVLLHYERAYADSNAYLGRVVDSLGEEPRVGIYLGMNHFHLGEQAEAVRWIERAARLPHADPDVYYCRAEIRMDDDPGEALRDLERYLALTEGAPDSSPSKQAMVRRKARDLERCLGAKVPTECMRIARVLRLSAAGLVGGLVLVAGVVGLRRRGHTVDRADEAP